MTTDFRALCAELLYALENEGYAHWIVPPDRDELCLRARAALAQPEPEGATDEELLRCYGLAKRDHCYEGPMDDWPKRAERAATAHGLRAVLTRYARPTIEPVPVSERLPGPEDNIRRADDDWCWGQERSLLTGKSAARWRLMRVSCLTEEAVTWLPHHALPVPQQEVK